jgi:hypothetical protein
MGNTSQPEEKTALSIKKNNQSQDSFGLGGYNPFLGSRSESPSNPFAKPNSTFNNPFIQAKFAQNTVIQEKCAACEAEEQEEKSIQRAVAPIQRDLAIEPPNPEAVPTELTEAQISSALHYNLDRFANSAEILEIRDVLGLSTDAEHPIDRDFVLAIARWQAMHNMIQDGKLGANTLTPLIAEFRAEGNAPRADRLAIRTRPDERRNNIDVNGHNNLFDAYLSHRNAMLTLIMRINFQFHPNSAGVNLTAAEQAAFVRRFERHVQQVWAEQYALVPRDTVPDRYLDTYFANVDIQSSVTNPHYTAHITNTATEAQSTDPPGAIGAGGPAAHYDQHWLRMGDEDANLYTGMSRGGFRMNQYTDAHEFGHMMGLDHIHCDRNDDSCYGVTDRERANIMGLGNEVTRANYLPFTEAMRTITGVRWRAR